MAQQLHKDFYLANPHHSLQCDEWHWGNLEEAHPVLGCRPWEEVQRFRREKGLHVERLKGPRVVPKPFQTFNETSFPEFVIQLAYELFTQDALPFPVQAQAWPCVLSGMDTVAIAPTGSGKTLAYLLPAFVHTMAQPALLPGEGPNVVMLVPTRHLAEQTHAVAQRFCERQRASSGEGLEAGVAFGGVDQQLQLPPAGGHWPEMLVATPGRLLVLLRRKLLPLAKSSYIVIDEADLLLTQGSWLEQVGEVLKHCHPQRQLIFVSATWSSQLDKVAAGLAGDELVKLQQFPDVPKIPQEVQLFQETQDVGLAPDRKAALLTWLRQELKPEEVVLLLCERCHAVEEVAADLEIKAALGGGIEKLVEKGEGQEYSKGMEHYKRFVSGEVRMLVATTAVGARGLDYADTVAAAAERLPGLSLVVVVFDFPQTMAEYIHCIGRCARPGQRSGRVLTFFPWVRFWMAAELLALLQRCGQEVPGPLEELVETDAAFLACCAAAMDRMKEGLEPWEAGSERAYPFGESAFDARKCLWTLPSCLSSYQRRLLHILAGEADMPHVSTYMSDGRRLHLAPDRWKLPEKFFIEGERVKIEEDSLSHKQDRKSLGRVAYGNVTVARIHRKHRTVLVRFDGWEREEAVCVDYLQLVEERDGGEGDRQGNGA